MAMGLRFYREQDCEGLANSSETELFTLQINSMFDALNKKFPAEGIRKNSKDLEVYYVLHGFCVSVFKLFIGYVCRSFYVM